MGNRENLIAEISRLLDAAPDRCLRCVLHFLIGWKS